MWPESLAFEPARPTIGRNDEIGSLGDICVLGRGVTIGYDHGQHAWRRSFQRPTQRRRALHRLMRTTNGAPT